MRGVLVTRCHSAVVTDDTSVIIPFPVRAVAFATCPTAFLSRCGVFSWTDTDDHCSIWIIETSRSHWKSERHKKGTERMLAQIGLRLTLSDSAGTLRGTDSGSIKTRLCSYDAGVAELLIDRPNPPMAAEFRMVQTGISPADPGTATGTNRIAQRCSVHYRKVRKLATHTKSPRCPTLTTVPGIRRKP